MLRHADVLDVHVVDSDGKDVARLAQGLDRPAGTVGLTWNGRDWSGAIALDGLYRLRVHLRHARRSILVPTTTLLDTMPPRVTVAPLASATLSPGQPGAAGVLDIRLRSNEPGRAILLVDGRIGKVGGLGGAVPGLVSVLVEQV